MITYLLHSALQPSRNCTEKYKRFWINMVQMIQIIISPSAFLGSGKPSKCEE